MVGFDKIVKKQSRTEEKKTTSTDSADILMKEASQFHMYLKHIFSELYSKSQDALGTGLTLKQQMQLMPNTPASKEIVIRFFKNNQETVARDRKTDEIIQQTKKNKQKPFFSQSDHHPRENSEIYNYIMKEYQKLQQGVADLQAKMQVEEREKVLSKEQINALGIKIRAIKSYIESHDESIKSKVNRTENLLNLMNEVFSTSLDIENKNTTNKI